MNEKFEKKEKMKITFYPYTYVRTLVMRSKKLQKEDFNNLIKMDIQEIINFLQSKGYTEFASLANEYKGIELIERSLKKHLVFQFNKLRKISNEDLKEVIDAYLMRYDLRNLKTSFRGLKFKQKVNHLIVPAGVFSENFYNEIVKKDNIEEVYPLLRNSIFYSIRNFKNETLFELENNLDKIYYDYLFSFVSNLGNQSKLFKEFTMEEVKVRNILTILKILKENNKENTKKLDIKKVLLPYNGSSLIKKLKFAKNLDEAIVILKKSRYKKSMDVLLDDFKKSGSLINLEKEIRKHLLNKLKHYAFHNILSIDVILDFMFEQDIEVKNLLLIFKAKIFGMDKKFIEDNLII